MWDEGVNAVWDLWEWGNLGFEQILWFPQFRESCDGVGGVWGEGADELGSSQGNTGMTFWGFWLECGQALASEGEGVSKHDLL